MTYEDALRVFRSGRLQGILDNLNADTVRKESRLRILFAYVSALTDDVPTAESLAGYEDSRLSRDVYSQLELTRAIVAWRSGNREKAWQYFQSAVRAGRESKDNERLAWANLHLLRFAIEVDSPDVAEAVLQQTRTAVIGAGIPYLTAYLHVCVSILEGQRGNLSHAWRHCDLAESMLRLEPNAWVEGALFSSRGVISALRCEFRESIKYATKAYELTAVTGSRRARAAAEIMLGRALMSQGQFEEAERALQNALKGESVEYLRAVGAAETLARLYLATGELEKCRTVLEPLFLRSTVRVPNQHAERWSALTKANLLLRTGRSREALDWLTRVERDFGDFRDAPFNATLSLLVSEAFARIGNRTECARRIATADCAAAAQNREIEGQFQYGIGTLVGYESPAFARQLQERARRIWSRQNLVAAPLELGATFENMPSDATEWSLNRKDTVNGVINAIRAMFDLAHDASLVGAEIVDVLRLSALNTNARLISGNRVGRRASKGSIAFPLTKNVTHSSSELWLECESPTNVSNAVAISDVVRLGRAAIALERAQQHERQQAAIWPPAALEQEAGGVFVADEMRTLLDTARRAAAANIPILITGETGTGKEVLARLIHGYSPRAAKTFLPFNCSATPREMLDSQLFGYRRGAFTGATENFAGVIRAAHGGTLFLDEIGESTLDIQPKLLRFLESGEVHPIGETHPQKVDVRVLAATNADVDELVAQGRFREDLFYRLNIIRLHIPPLRERRVEIPSFAQHYLQKHAKEIGKGDLRISEETMEYLVLYRWPGNVRQIANEMRRLAALAEPNAVIMPEHLSPEIAASRRTVPASERTLDPSEIVVRIDQPLSAALQHVEQTMVQTAMAKAKSVDEAARLLGLSRKGLYLKRLRFGMAIDKPRGEIEVA